MEMIIMSCIWGLAGWYVAIAGWLVVTKRITEGYQFWLAPCFVGLLILQGFFDRNMIAILERMVLQIGFSAGSLLLMLWFIVDRYGHIRWNYFFFRASPEPDGYGQGSVTQPPIGPLYQWGALALVGGLLCGGIGLPLFQPCQVGDRLLRISGCEAFRLPYKPILSEVAIGDQRIAQSKSFWSSEKVGLATIEMVDRAGSIKIGPQVLPGLIQDLAIVDDRYIMSCTNHSCRLWDSDTTRVVWQFDRPMPIDALAMDVDQTQIAFSYDQRVIQVRSIGRATGWEMTPEVGSIKQLVWSSSNRLAIIGSEQVAIWDMASRRPITRQALSGYWLRWSPDGQTLLLWSDSRALVLSADGNLIEQIDDGPFREGNIAQAVVTNDRRVWMLGLCCGLLGRDSVVLYDLNQQTATVLAMLPQVRSVYVSRDGQAVTIITYPSVGLGYYWRLPMLKPV